MVFIYDGTFEGFLSTVFDAYTAKTNPMNIVSSRNEMQVTLNSDYHYVETSDEKADRLMAGLCKIGISDKIIKSFLSWTPNREMTIFRYIVMGFKDMVYLTHKLDDDIIRKVTDMCTHTEREKMKWKGFLRFSVMDNNVYYAEMSPKNNVLTLIMPHFGRRFNTKPFLIHDMTYKQVGLYDTREWYLMPSDGLTVPQLHTDEAKYRYLWKLFYDTTAMEGRLNHKRRRQVMPERYRKHITELQDQTVPDTLPEHNNANRLNAETGGYIAARPFRLIGI